MNERTLFDAALEFEDSVKRRVFLEKACEGNQELLHKVLSLLEAHEKASSFLEDPAIRLGEQDFAKASQDSDVDKTRDFSIDKSKQAFSQTPTIAESEDDDDNDIEQPELSFLKPSIKPGSIGSLRHYEILKVLGQGGFGIVFKAFDERLHRLVAIKVMNSQMAATSPPRKRFLREARSAAAIKHENIVQVYSVEEDPLPYMVMEFIDGLTLQERLDGDGPLEIDEILTLGCQIAKALASAHGLGIIHRDIKPGNILIEQGIEPKIKVTDFGLARAADDASMTRSGMISGTPMYMAPEQALGQQLDHRSDLFSLGSVLYQMACGRAPFRAPSAIAILRRVAEDTPRPLQEILPSIPDWLVAVVEKLLAKKPDDRFQSAKEVADLLALYKSEILLHGKVTSFAGSHQPSTQAKNNAGFVNSHDSSLGHPKRIRLIYAVSVIACLLLTGTIVSFLLPGNRDHASKDHNEPESKTIVSDSQSATKDDRFIATGILSLPGNPSITIEGRTDWLSKPEELPAGMIKITNVELYGESGFGDESLIQLGACEKLLRVGLNGGSFSQLTDNGFLKFSRLPAAKSIIGFDIWADVPQLSDKFIEALNRMPQLERVHIPGSRISDEGMQQLKLPKLKSLVFWGKSPAISMQSLVGLDQRSPDLQEISIGLLSLHNDDLVPLSAFTKLQRLQVESTEISSKALKVVAKLPNLVKLYIGENKRVDDEAMKSIAVLKNLEELRVSGTGITDRSCELIASLPKLRILGIDNNEITNKGLEYLCRMPSLKELTVRNCTMLTEEGVHKLRASLPECKIESDFSGLVSVDDRAIAEWALGLPIPIGLMIEGQVDWLRKREGLPSGVIKVERISLPNIANDFSDEDLIRIGRCKHLQGLEVFGSALLDRITDEGIRKFSESAAAKGLQQFEVYPTPSLTDASIKHLNRLVSLKVLRIHAGSITDSGLNRLQLPGLTALSIEFVPITSAGLKDLNTRFPNLEYLTLQALQLGDDDLSFLSQLKLKFLSIPLTAVATPAMRTVGQMNSLTDLFLFANESLNDECVAQLTGLSQLHVLRLDGTSITDAGLESLSKLQSLELLNVSNCKRLTEAGVRKLQKALPACKIVSDFPE